MNELEKLFYPLGLVWLSLIGGAIVSWRRRQHGTAAFFIVLAAGISLFGSTPLSAWLLAGLERKYQKATIAHAAATDAVVMLGGIATASSRDALGITLGTGGSRFLTAVEVVRQGKAKNLLFGGGPANLRHVKSTEGRAFVDLVQRWDLVKGQVIDLTPSRNTEEEAEHALELAKQKQWTRLTIVTSAAHMRRAEAIFSKKGVHVETVASDFVGMAALEGAGKYSLVPTVDGLRVMGLYLHEKLGWWYYRLKGWV